MRLSKREAEAEAIRIAKEFVAANGELERTCGGAKPDVLASGYRRRKNIIKWTVLFDRSVGGTITDGPAIVHVDIETGEAEFF
jgi:hypothetical protein